MKVVFNLVIHILVSGLIMFFTISFQACQNRNNLTEKDTIVKQDTMVKHDTNRTSIDYKPNIYIYSQKGISLKVNIVFPKGGKILTSMPLYENGWNIIVDPTGKINRIHKFLFYESEHPDYWQYKSGWIVEKDSLKGFFQNNMAEYGFNNKEIKDFTDYWIPKFDKNKYYVIYPQEKNLIDALVMVNYSVKPDGILRLYYAIKGTDVKPLIDNHIIKNKFSRNGFYTTEWGVVLVN